MTGDLMRMLVDFEKRLHALETIELPEGPWTAYSATSTVTGWSSFTTKLIYYKRVGKLMFVTFNLQGTSDATSGSFTLPYAAADVGHNTVIRVTDNGTAAFGAATITAGSSTCNLYPDAAATSWTASGTKVARGWLVYQTE